MLTRFGKRPVCFFALLGMVALACPSIAFSQTLDWQGLQIGIEVDDACTPMMRAMRDGASAEELMAIREANRGVVSRGGEGPQVVYIDWNNDDGTYSIPLTTGSGFYLQDLPSHVYTAQQQSDILGRLQDDFAGYDVTFVTTEPSGGDYMTVTLNDNEDPLNGPGMRFEPSTSTLFTRYGRAEAVDFRNLVRNDAAGVDMNQFPFLWFLEFELGLTGFFEASTGVPATVENLEALIVTNTAKYIAHEVGHNLGLKHLDTFGAPGDGLAKGGLVNAADFTPTYTGPQDATESLLHTMATGVTGLPIGLHEHFFSERSAHKLVLAESAAPLAEAPGVQLISLDQAVAPNTIVTGENAGGANLVYQSALVLGRLDVMGEADEYEFDLFAGDVVTVDVTSYANDFNPDPVDTTVDLYFVDPGDQSLSLVASNASTFESVDPTIIDALAPSTGSYRVVVTSTVGSPFSSVGDYDLLIYSFVGTGVPPVDADGDGVDDSADNCTLVANAGQQDSNGDSIGNICDADLDGDCTVNFSDLGLMKAAFFSTDADADLDSDGTVNFADLGILKANFFMPPGPSGLPNACDGS